MKSSEGRHSPHRIAGSSANDLHKRAQHSPSTDLSKDLGSCGSLSLIPTNEKANESTDDANRRVWPEGGYGVSERSLPASAMNGSNSAYARWPDLPKPQIAACRR